MNTERGRDMYSEIIGNKRVRKRGRGRETIKAEPPSLVLDNMTCHLNLVLLNPQRNTANSISMTASSLIPGQYHRILPSKS